MTDDYYRSCIESVRDIPNYGHFSVLHKRVYLCTPYSHDSQQVRSMRFRQAAQIAGLILKRKIWVYSPICHTHPIAMHGGMELSFDQWEEYDYSTINLCTEVWVAKLEGWHLSDGIKRECGYAFKEVKPIYGLEIYIDKFKNVSAIGEPRELFWPRVREHLTKEG